MKRSLILLVVLMAWSIPQPVQADPGGNLDEWGFIYQGLYLQDFDQGQSLGIYGPVMEQNDRVITIGNDWFEGYLRIWPTIIPEMELEGENLGVIISPNHNLYITLANADEVLPETPDVNLPPVSQPTTMQPAPTPTTQSDEAWNAWWENEGLENRSYVFPTIHTYPIPNFHTPDRQGEGRVFFHAPVESYDQELLVMGSENFTVSLTCPGWTGQIGDWIKVNVFESGEYTVAAVTPVTGSSGNIYLQVDAVICTGTLN